MTPLSQQSNCFNLLNLLHGQPMAIKKSHWARHWACAVDIFELLTTNVAAGDLKLFAGNKYLADNNIKTLLVTFMTWQGMAGVSFCMADNQLPAGAATQSILLYREFSP